MEIFNPVNIVVSAIIVVAIIALVIVAIRKIVLWVKRRNAEGVEPN